MKNIRKKSSEDAWENGDLGQSEEFIRKVSPEREAAVEQGLGLKMISLRLQSELIDAIKALAKESGLSYQPYIRHLLTQHVNDKKKRTGTGR